MIDRTQHRDKPDPTPNSTPGPAPASVPEAVKALRAAVYQAVSAEDIKAIVEKQVEKAKTGDVAATKFVFDYLLGGGPKVQTVVQNILIQQTESAKPAPAVAPVTSLPRIREGSSPAPAREPLPPPPTSLSKLIAKRAAGAKRSGPGSIPPRAPDELDQPPSAERLKALAERAAGGQALFEED